MAREQIAIFPAHFPPELLIVIFSHLRSPIPPDEPFRSPRNVPPLDGKRNPTLLSAALVCRGWSPYALAELYTHLEVQWVQSLALKLTYCFAWYCSHNFLVARSLRVHFVTRDQWLRNWVVSQLQEDRRTSREEHVSLMEDPTDNRRYLRWRNYSLETYRKLRAEGFIALEASVDKDWITSLSGRFQAVAFLSVWVTRLLNLEVLDMAHFNISEKKIIEATPSIRLGQLFPTASVSIFKPIPRLFSHLKVFKSRQSLFNPYPLGDSSVEVVDIHIQAWWRPFSVRSECRLPNVTHLRLIHCCTRAAICPSMWSMFDTLPTISPERLEAVELFDPTPSDIDTLMSWIPSLEHLSSLVVYTSKCDIFSSHLESALDDPSIATALSQLPLQHLSISFWPSPALMPFLPRTIRSLALDCRDHGERFRPDFLRTAIRWKEMYLPALEFVEASPRKVRKIPVPSNAPPGRNFRVFFRPYPRVTVEEPCDALPGKYNF
ncbi:hypothetical protein P7C70_g3432, partial [Phenoliferia sp. Uapishka_3]